MAAEILARAPEIRGCNFLRTYWKLWRHNHRIQAAHLEALEFSFEACARLDELPMGGKRTGRSFAIRISDPAAAQVNGALAGAFLTCVAS